MKIQTLMNLTTFAFPVIMAAATGCGPDKEDKKDPVEEAGEAIEEGAEEVADEIDDATDDK